MKKRYVLLGAIVAATGAGICWAKKHVKVKVCREYEKTNHTKEDGSTLFIGGAIEREDYLADLLDHKTGSFVITDPKGTYFDTFAEQLSERGYEIKVLNLTDSEKMEASGTQCFFDPFKYIDTSKGGEELVINTAKTLAGDNFFDEFEKNAVTSLLIACIYWLKENQCKEDGNNLKFLTYMLKEAKSNPTFCYLLEKSFMGISGQTKAKKYFQAAKQASGRELATVIQKTANILEQISHASGIEQQDSLDLKSIGEEKTALFIVTSENCREKKLIELLYTQLFTCVYKERRKDNMDELAEELPIYCFLSQFEEYPNITKLEEVIQTGRLYSVYPTVCVSKFDQERINPGYYDQIVSFNVSESEKVEKFLDQDHL